MTSKHLKGHLFVPPADYGNYHNKQAHYFRHNWLEGSSLGVTFSNVLCILNSYF